MREYTATFVCKSRGHSKSRLKFKISSSGDVLIGLFSHQNLGAERNIQWDCGRLSFLPFPQSPLPPLPQNQESLLRRLNSPLLHLLGSFHSSSFLSSLYLCLSPLSHLFNPYLSCLTLIFSTVRFPCIIFLIQHVFLPPAVRVFSSRFFLHPLSSSSFFSCSSITFFLPNAGFL